FGPSDSAACAAGQQLALVLCDGAYDTLPGLTIPLHPSSQPPLLLVVAVTARALAALPKEEATLSRRSLYSRYDTAGRTARAIDATRLSVAQLRRQHRVARDRPTQQRRPPQSYCTRKASMRPASAGVACSPCVAQSMAMTTDNTSLASREIATNSRNSM